MHPNITSHKIAEDKYAAIKNFTGFRHYLDWKQMEGTEGKLFRPMALTVLFALIGSLILSLTFMPAIASLVLPKKMEEKENREEIM